MLFLSLTPYFFFLLGIGFRLAGIRPAILTWAMVMLGALSSLTAAMALVIQDDHAALVLVAGVPFIVVAVTTAKDLTYPLINDISTDVDRPPQFIATQDLLPNTSRDLAFPERNPAIIRAAYPRLRGIHLDMSPQEVLHRALALIKEDAHWHVTRRDDDAGQLEVEVTTPYLGFVDDVILRAERHGTCTRVDMRSKSREGLVDGGTNAARITHFLCRLAMPDV